MVVLGCLVEEVLCASRAAGGGAHLAVMQQASLPAACLNVIWVASGTWPRKSSRVAWTVCLSGRSGDLRSVQPPFCRCSAREALSRVLLPAVKRLSQVPALLAVAAQLAEPALHPPAAASHLQVMSTAPPPPPPTPTPPYIHIHVCIHQPLCTHVCIHQPLLLPLQPAGPCTTMTRTTSWQRSARACGRMSGTRAARTMRPPRTSIRRSTKGEVSGRCVCVSRVGRIRCACGGTPACPIVCVGGRRAGWAGVARLSHRHPPAAAAAVQVKLLVARPAH